MTLGEAHPVAVDRAQLHSVDLHPRWILVERGGWDPGVGTVVRTDEMSGQMSGFGRDVRTDEMSGGRVWNFRTTL